jgi:hypothetical protein
MEEPDAVECQPSGTTLNFLGNARSWTAYLDRLACVY